MAKILGGGLGPHLRKTGRGWAPAPLPMPLQVVVSLEVSLASKTMEVACVR